MLVAVFIVRVFGQSGSFADATVDGEGSEGCEFLTDTAGLCRRGDRPEVASVLPSAGFPGAQKASEPVL